MSENNPKLNQVGARELFRADNFFAFGFGAGLSRIAPGTFGTLIAIPFFIAMYLAGDVIYVTVTVTALLIGIPLCARAAKSLNTADHPAIVWDEIVGFWIAMIFIPLSPATVIIGFLLFRFFDIVKPFPIGWIDRRIHGGLGIMLDDVIAGVFANIILRLLLPYL